MPCQSLSSMRPARPDKQRQLWVALSLGPGLTVKVCNYCGRLNLQPPRPTCPSWRATLAVSHGKQQQHIPRSLPKCMQQPHHVSVQSGMVMLHPVPASLPVGAALVMLAPPSAAGSPSRPKEFCACPSFALPHRATGSHPQISHTRRGDHSCREELPSSLGQLLLRCDNQASRRSYTRVQGTHKRWGLGGCVGPCRFAPWGPGWPRQGPGLGFPCWPAHCIRTRDAAGATNLQSVDAKIDVLWVKPALVTGGAGLTHRRTMRMQVDGWRSCPPTASTHS